MQFTYEIFKTDTHAPIKNQKTYCLKEKKNNTDTTLLINYEMKLIFNGQVYETPKICILCQVTIYILDSHAAKEGIYTIFSMWGYSCCCLAKQLTKYNCRVC